MHAARFSAHVDKRYPLEAGKRSLGLRDVLSKSSFDRLLRPSRLQENLGSLTCQLNLHKYRIWPRLTNRVDELRNERCLNGLLRTLSHCGTALCVPTGLHLKSSKMRVSLHIFLRTSSIASNPNACYAYGRTLLRHCLHICRIKRITFIRRLRAKGTSPNHRANVK
jgi:hypothetical protein